jgi:hypothetical protein
MKKRLIVATVAATAAALVGGISAAAPAQADPGSKGYVTRAEFKKVKKGMQIQKAHKIFGAQGKQTTYFPAYPSIGIKAEQWREYKTASKWGFVDITYTKVNGVWKVKSKTAYWG